ncbi:MAG: O-antigen ligase family protein [Patescibacteria group bacterium]
MINKVLFFLLLLLLPTQFGKHFFLDFSYLFGVRVDYLAPVIYLTDIIVFSLTVINFKIVFKFFKNKKIIFSSILLLINVSLSQLMPISIYWFIKIIEILIIVSLSKKMLIVLKEKNILLALLLSGLFEFFLSLYQLINKHSFQGIFYYFGERLLTLSLPGVAKASVQGVEFLRPYGTFSHPNSLAGFFLLLYFFVLTHKKFDRYLILKYLFLFVCSILVFISFSKVAIIGYLILNILYSILNTKISCRLCKVARIIVLSIISLIFLQATTDPLTINKRIELIKNSAMIVLSHPIFGVGLGSYLIGQIKYPSKYHLFFNQPVHNIFLLFISEMGLLIGGVLVYLVVNRLIKQKLTKNQWLLIFVIIFTGFFDHYWLTLQQNFLLMGLVMGVTLSRAVPVD